jgi:hypothetical protein
VLRQVFDESNAAAVTGVAAQIETEITQARMKNLALVIP